MVEHPRGDQDLLKGVVSLMLMKKMMMMMMIIC
jgi:hypothetical protein